MIIPDNRFTPVLTVCAWKTLIDNKLLLIRKISIADAINEKRAIRLFHLVNFDFSLTLVFR